MSTILFKTAAFVASLLTWRGAQRLGALLGLGWFHVVRIRRRVVLGNIAMALPERSADKKIIAKEAYRHFGVSCLEFLKMGAMSKAEIGAVVHPRGMEHFQEAHARGRGVIVVTAHFGNFDLLACAEAAMGIPLAIVSRDLHDRAINRFWMSTRMKSGLKVLPARGAARQILDWLRRGNVVGLTVDQRTPKEKGGVLADFMGWRVWTSTAAASLALATGAALLPVRVERRADGEHEVWVEPEIPPARESGICDARELTERINELVGSWVARRPDHWMWLHRRFVGAESKPGLSHCH